MMTPIPIFIIGPENWEASHVFNPNAFPQHVVVPISASTGENVDKLYDAIKEHLT